ncbi:hypothetical protein G7Y89_g5388 [Cudoniella acicularis]|uniref:Uncharacterized protein n=1 Tax=Cudoniella acicularis TaxID=354080 RepID=A0A8H4W6J3_9HELO|nr:hypothetical protein G7Y89_g5388 [Cudoniella acicularis]
MLKIRWSIYSLSLDQVTYRGLFGWLNANADHSHSQMPCLNPTFIFKTQCEMNNEGFWKETSADDELFMQQCVDSHDSWTASPSEYDLLNEISSLHDKIDASAPIPNSATLVSIEDENLVDSDLLSQTPQNLWTSLGLETGFHDPILGASSPSTCGYRINNQISYTSNPYQNFEDDGTNQRLLFPKIDSPAPSDTQFANSPTNTGTPSSANSESWIPEDITHMGYQDAHGNWRCKYSGYNMVSLSRHDKLLKI